MKFQSTPIDAVMLISLDEKRDQRGFFARTYCRDAFREAGIEFRVAQQNISHTRKAGTVRGLHYQTAPSKEAKLVRCVAGAIRDVLVDMREGSPSYRSTYGVELSAANGLSIYVPPMVAHGFQALTDDVIVTYSVSCDHDPEAERGVRHDDPALGIDWPLPVTEISDKDSSWPLLGAPPSG